jgi:hypothetical protein
LEPGEQNEQVDQKKKKKKKKERQQQPVVNTGPLNDAPPEVRQKKIVINTFRTEYPLIDRIATEVMGWRVIKEEDFTVKDFDLLWFDTGIDGYTLAQLKPY